MKRMSAAAVVLGMPPLLGETPREKIGLADGRGRTLFFNFSHLKDLDTTHFLYVAGRKYRLTRIQDEPGVLGRERRRNEFLRSLPDDQITHHVRGVRAPADTITLAYTTCSEDPGAGTWGMTSLHFLIPQPAVSHAYARARERTPAGPLPRSGKRARYAGVRPAMTEQDFLEETSMIDITNHAEALVGLHPDVLSIEPNSGAHIQLNYVSTDSNTQELGSLLAAMPPAMPPGAANVSRRLPPWATLVPLINDDTGMPFKKSDKALNQYYPDWSPLVDQKVAGALGTVHPTVRDDASLGVDVTGYNLNDPGNPIPPENLLGKVWARHDGIPTVHRSLGAPAGSGPSVAFTYQGSEVGLVVGQPTIKTLSDGRVQVKLDNVSNWFLRWLGLWVQFLDPNGNAIQLSAFNGGPAPYVPDDLLPDSNLPGPYPRGIDKSDAMFLGVVAPATTLFGIPVSPGQFSPTLRIPDNASAMRILYAGPGLSGSRPQEPAGIYGAGIGMTVAFNYAVVGLFMAVGTSTYEPTFKLAVSIGGGILAAEIQQLIGGLLDDADFAKGMAKAAMNTLKILFQVGFTKALVQIVANITEELVLAEVIDSIPVAGSIARAVAAVVGAIQLAQTTLEIDISPPAYVFEVVLTHDLSITIRPDSKTKVFPQPPDSSYTLYYKVSYLFDQGTAHNLDSVDVTDTTVSSISITLNAVPRGGMVDIAIGFYMRKNTTPAGQNDWCAGQGRTGLVSNVPDQAPDLTITNTLVPIQSSTRYLHKMKTVLDGDGNHHWFTTDAAPPYVAPPGGQLAGLGDLNSITVRQGTSNPPQFGYVGYAWQALSADVNGCDGGAQGQFDQLANLNTDAGNNGANAQSGYVNSADLCGFQHGVRMSYNLLAQNAPHIYFDTKSLKIRPISLSSYPPTFAGPSSNQSYGQLNLASDRCLLHPAGHIVSINTENHKIEILKLPRVKGQIAAVSDDDASGFFLARTCSGVGAQPGLLKSPVAAAISPDGAILVLEKVNQRIQAFDLGGNPAPYFKGQSPKYFLSLEAIPSGSTFLDLAVEFSGYLYVLSKDANDNHRLDIYHPTQSGTKPICTTPGVNAAKLAVDFWRGIYTLNYEVLRTPGGTIPGFTEPSVSQWLPTPPQV
jgi:hypothetical protein